MSAYLYRPDESKDRHRQLKRLILAARDMDLAVAALETVIALKDNPRVCTHIIAAAVIYYARPFVSGRSWSTISGKWEKFDDASMRETHIFITKWRNTVIAHTDDELHQVEFVPKGSRLVVRTDDGKEGVLTMSAHGELLQTPQFPMEVVGRFLDLCRYQGQRIKANVSLQKETLFHEFLKPAV